MTSAYPYTSPRQLAAGRTNRSRLLGLLLSSLLLSGAPMPGLLAARDARAAEGDSQTLIYIGSSLVAIDDAYSQGTTFGARWGYEFQDDLLWTVGGAFSTTDGTQTVSGAQYDIHANSTTVQSGLLYFFGRRPRKLVLPFVGGGIAAIDYAVDYRYPGSKVGQTSGTGPGVFAFAGVEIWLARAITFILSYQVDAYQIARQDRHTDTLASGGVLLALRINVYSSQ
jgi:hypothetical protein